MGWTVLEDSNHIIHFGCNALVSFDGDHWRVDKAGASYAIRGLDEDGRGRIWACGVGEIGWFERDDSFRWNFHSLKALIPASVGALGEMWHVFATRSGAVFVSSDRVLIWDGKTFNAMTLFGSRRLSAMRFEGRIYIDYMPSGLLCLNDGELTPIVPERLLKGAVVFWIERSGASLLLATSRGFYSFSNGQLKDTMAEASAYIRSYSLTTVVKLDASRIAIGTLSGGIMVLRENGAVDKIITTANGLPTNEVFSLGVDHDHGLWATTSSDICRISIDDNVQVLGVSAGLGLPCESIGKITDGVAIGSGTRVIGIEENTGRISEITDGRRHIWSLANVPEGLLVAENFGLDLISENRVSSLFRSSEDAFAISPAIVEGGNLASVGRSVIKFDSRTGSKRSVITDLPDIATSLAEDRRGNIWAGTTTAGLLRIRSDPRSEQAAIEAVRREQGDAVGRSAAAETGDGSVLVFAESSGWLVDADNDKLSPIEGWPHLHLSAFSRGSDAKSLWTIQENSLAGEPKLGVIKVEHGRAFWKPRIVEGLWLVGTAACMLEESSNKTPMLWIGGNKGIVKIGLTQISEATELPKPIVAVLARGSDIMSGYKIVAGPLSYDTSNVIVDVAVPSYSARRAISCETRIVGIDPDWVPLDPSGIRTLGKMRDGTYSFYTRVHLNEKFQEASTTFSVRPPWWRSTGFSAIIALGLVGVGFGTSRYRIKAIKRRAEQLEEIVRKRTHDLERANAAKAEFVANLSHDIRNPLNGIIGTTFALEAGLESRERAKLIRTIRQCAQFLDSLVAGVLDLSKIEAEKLEIQTARYSPRALLGMIVEIASPEAELYGAELLTSFDPQIPEELMGDSRQIERIMINYVLNAIRYAGGLIVISAKRLVGDQMEVEYAVKDCGPGVRLSDQAFIFERYSRLGPAANPVSSGYGLGLAVCKRLAELMNGTVGVDSSPGNGARFFLKLQIVEPEAMGTRSRCDFGETSRILLVEDSDYNAWAIGVVLNRVKIGVPMRVKSGTDAMQMLMRQDFDLILLDGNLPDCEGTDLCKRIRDIKAGGEKCKILYISARPIAEDMASSIEHLFDAVIEKPITPEKFKAAFSEMVAAPKGKMFEMRSGVTTRFDDSLLRFLAGNDSDAYKNELIRYLVVLESKRTKLATVWQKGDRTEIGRAAHELIAHAKFVGASKLIDSTMSLEKECVNGLATLDPKWKTAIDSQVSALEMNIRLALGANLDG